MPNVIQLDLPEPSAKIIEALKTYSKHKITATWLAKKQELDNFHGNNTNAVLHHFDSPEFLNKLIQTEFQHLFPKHKVSGLLGIMKNIKKVPGCLPPHCDRIRAVGLGYFLEVGGDNVKTVFYDRKETIVGVTPRILYSEINPVEQHVFKQGSWYGYNVDCYHSVEGIESTRLMVAVRLIRPELDADEDFEYNLEDFQRDYPHLCIDNND
jgi:hypothetical protein